MSQIFLGLGLILLVRVFKQPENGSWEFWFLIIGAVMVALAVEIAVTRIVNAIRSSK